MQQPTKASDVVSLIPSFWRNLEFVCRFALLGMWKPFYCDLHRYPLGELSPTL